MHLTLLVPELIWPEPADQFTLGKLSAPGLEWLLALAGLKPTGLLGKKIQEKV